MNWRLQQRKRNRIKEANRKSRSLSPSVADECETATKKKKQDKKEASRKSRTLSPKVIIIQYHVPIPVLGLKTFFIVLQNFCIHTESN